MTAAILAGGQARRFGGRQKALLPIGGQRIIDRLLAVLRSVADHVLIVANERHLYDALGVPVREDVLPHAGPLGGIYTALVATTTPQTLVVAGDMPFLSVPFLRHLAQVGRNVDVAIPCTVDGYHPLCASYGDRCVSIIERQIGAGALKVADLLSGIDVHELGPDETARFDPDGTLFFNVNTPGAYARSLALAAHRRL